MRKYVINILLLLFVLLLPVAASAQVRQPGSKTTKTQAKPKDQKSIKVNKLDVIDKNDEYSGVVIDYNEKHPTPEEDASVVYERPFILNPPASEDESEEDFVVRTFTTSEDEGAESEDEILRVGDSTMIHMPKLDISSMLTPVYLQLTDSSHGMRFCYPTPDFARPSSHWGPRRRRFHYGLDLALKTGEPIYAAFDGVVRISLFNRSYGNLVVIRHNNGLETYYAHLSKRHVTPGTQVRAGDIIGLCGNTGRSHGSHLHFEIRYQGNAMNPETVIDCGKQNLISNTLVLTSESFRKVAQRSSGAVAQGKSSSNYSSDGKYYKVRKGDTLSKIAKRNGTTVRKLCQLNKIRETSVIRDGQRLRIR